MTDEYELTPDELRRFGTREELERYLREREAAQMGVIYGPRRKPKQGVQNNRYSPFRWMR